MMMMPFVRLLAIYALVGMAIFAFLKRDELGDYFSTPEPEMATPNTKAAAEASPPVDQNTTAPAEATSTQAQPSAFSAPPVFGSEVTPQYFGQAAPATAPAPAVQNGGNMVARWTRARELFSQGNITEATRLYEALTSDFPDNADLHGETGNLYYNLGQFGKAAAHYFTVGEIAARKGDRQMTGTMMAVLQRISPSKAAALQAIVNAGR